MTFKPSIALSITFVFFIVMTSCHALAQEEAGAVYKQLERKEITPPKAEKEPVIEQKQEEKATQTPSGIKILVKKINVNVQGKSPTEVSPLLTSQIITSITSRYENKELTLAEMNGIAEEITTAYRNEGYLVAYALVPQQEISDGVLQIAVIESKIGEISVTGNTSYSTDFIQKHLQKVEKDPSLREGTLVRALLLLNDYPSLDVKATLKAGKDFGTTDITAQVKDSRPLSGSLSYDNFGSDTTSKSRLIAEVNIGNLITSGDLLMLRGLTGLDKIDLENLSHGRLEYIIPVMYNGTKVGIYYTNSIYEAGEKYTILDIQGKAHVAGAYVTHPLVKTRNTSLDVRFGFDYKDIYQYMLDETTSADKIRVFNLGLNYNFVDGFYGRNILNLTYYQGVRDLFGGNGESDPGTSRMNADGQFSKGTLELARIQKLPGYNYFILRASGQYSNDDLFVAEQFFLGGVGSVRGFSPSLLSGDKGYFISGELYIAPPYPETKIFNQNLGDTFKLVLFADHGGVFKNDVQPGEDKDDYLTSIGAGLRLYITKYISARLDWAVPKMDGHFETSDSETYLQLVFNF